MLQLLKQKWNYAEITIYLLFASVGIVYFSKAISNIVFGLAIFIFIVGLFKKEIKLNIKKEIKYKYLLIIIPFLLTVISTLISDNISKGFEFIWLRLPVLIAPFLVLFVSYSKKSIEQSMRLFIALTVVATLISLIKAVVIYTTETTFLNPEFAKDITPIQHPYFGIFLLIALVMLIKYRLFVNKFFVKISSIILILGILITTSRMVYLLAMLFFIIEFGKQFTVKKKIVLASVLLLLLMFLVNTNEKLHNKVYNTFDYWKSPRVWVWENSYRLVINSDKKVVGIGIGDYFNKKRYLVNFKRTHKGTVGYSTHNQYIEFIITNGLFGLLFIGSMVFLFFKVDSKKRIIFIIVALFAFTESILSRQFGVQLYALFVPFALYNTKDA